MSWNPTDSSDYCTKDNLEQAARLIQEAAELIEEAKPWARWPIMKMLYVAMWFCANRSKTIKLQ